MNSLLRSSYKTIITTACYAALKVYKIRTFLSSGINFIGASQVITPVLATHVSSRELLSITALRTLLHMLTYPAANFFGIFHHMPTLAGGLYFKQSLSAQSVRTKIVNFIAPLICIALFTSTPVGSQAWVYSVYWLIPSLLAIVPHRSIFLTALASTFMAHAVGSVLFILVTPMTPIFWLGLIPIVVYERCMIAAGITGLYYAVTLLQHLYKIAFLRLAHA